VIECWQRIYEKVSVVVNEEGDFIFNTWGWRASDVAKIKTIPGLHVIPRTSKKMRITTVAGTVLISDEDPADLACDDFYMIPAYAYRRGDKWWGKVEGAKDAQREVNKRHSQAVDVVNKAVNYGWLIDDSVFDDPAQESAFKETVTSPGFIAKVADLNRKPEKVESGKFPTELVQMMEISDNQVTDLLNIHVEPHGANESGTALLQKAKLKMTGNEFLFDNLSFAKKKMGKILLCLIKRYYTPERIWKMVTNYDRRYPQTIGGQPVSEVNQQDILNLLADADFEEMDVVVSESTHNDTLQLASFLILSELQQRGVAVPPETIVKLIPSLPQSEKDQLIASIQQQAQAAAEEAKTKERMETEKTLVAAGVMTPRLQNELETQARQIQETTQGQPAQAF
jgi:hypothetical protein